MEGKVVKTINTHVVLLFYIFEFKIPEHKRFFSMNPTLMVGQHDGSSLKFNPTSSFS